MVSLFDGISCAQVALKALGYEVNYYASEVDENAIKITQKNHPNTIQLGDVKNVKPEAGCKWIFEGVDLLIGGSPCQDLSIAKVNREGLSGARSGLFYEYVRILKELKPKYFVLENVASMSQEAKDTISKELGVEPIMINAALVSAQSRKRLFWTNIPGVALPNDRGIVLKDILEKGYTEREKSLAIQSSYGKKNQRDYFLKHQGQMVFTKPVQIGKIAEGMSGLVYSVEGKSVALKALGGGGGAKTGLYMIQTPRGKNKGGIVAKNGKTPTLTSSKWEHNNKLFDNGLIRKLTPIECERLQCLPDNYTEGLSNTQRYVTLGNAFNVEVVKHILSNMV